MKKLFITLAVLTAVILSVFPVSAADVPWINFLEAEGCLLDSGGAVEVVEADGAIGKALTCVEKQGDADGDGFTFTFDIPEDGSYTVWGRVYYPSQSNNSLHYSVDGGDSLVWDFADEDDAATACYNSWQYFYLTYREEGSFDEVYPYGSWSVENGCWRHSPNYLTLTKGSHSIHFTGREDGWYLDQFVVTKLKVDEYDPNYYEGNDAILPECKFCDAEWKHYTSDVYAAKGITAEDYFYNTLYYTAPEPEPTPEPEIAVETPEVEAVVESAPVVTTAAQTGDMLIFTLAAVVTVIAASKKR